MDWTQTNLLRAPSPNFQPDELPMSWVAACILTHLRTIYSQRASIGITRILELSNGPFMHLDSLEVAYALYTGLDRLAHDCYPNTIHNFSPEGCAERHAWRPIKAGEEITRSVVGNCIGTSRDKRAIALKWMLGAPCKCRACLENWPTVEAQRPQPPASFICKVCRRPIPAQKRVKGSQFCQCAEAVKVARATEFTEAMKLHATVFELLDTLSKSNQLRDIDRSFEALVALSENEDNIFPRDSRIHMETLLQIRTHLEMSKGNRRIIPAPNLLFEKELS